MLDPIDFLIVVPVHPSTTGSAGMRALVRLGTLLEAEGYTVALTVSPPVGGSEPFATAGLSERTIAIYPEVYSGNPSGAQRVIRWILHPNAVPEVRRWMNDGDRVISFHELGIEGVERVTVDCLNRSMIDAPRSVLEPTLPFVVWAGKLPQSGMPLLRFVMRFARWRRKNPTFRGRVLKLSSLLGRAMYWVGAKSLFPNSGRRLQVSRAVRRFDRTTRAATSAAAMGAALTDRLIDSDITDPLALADLIDSGEWLLSLDPFSMLTVEASLREARVVVPKFLNRIFIDEHGGVTDGSDSFSVLGDSTERDVLRSIDSAARFSEHLRGNEAAAVRIVTRSAGTACT